MTFREMLAKDYPDYVSDVYTGGCRECPIDYGYESEMPSECPGLCSEYTICSACWNREVPETTKKPSILDSGERRQFETGAVRDIQEGKGRCDLMPLEVVAKILNRDSLYNPDLVIGAIALFKNSDYRDTIHLYNALIYFADGEYHNCLESMFLDVAKHFEEGAEKYGENNWQKGLPAVCYINSAVRHYLKWRRGDQDEPHHRAFCWNIMCCIWEVDFSPRAKENVYDDKDNKTHCPGRITSERTG